MGSCLLYYIQDFGIGVKIRIISMHIKKNLKILFVRELFYFRGKRIHTSLRMTSGARYSGVPQNVFVVSVARRPSLERPKSVNTTWPCESNNKFSGFKSR